MFADVITRQPRFSSQVIRAIVNGPKSVTEIAKFLDVGKGGNITNALTQLVESGMVASDSGKNPETGVDMRECRYRLCDNYARFYLKYIEPAKDMIDSNAFHFDGLDRFAGWDSIKDEISQLVFYCRSSCRCIDCAWQCLPFRQRRSIHWNWRQRAHHPRCRLSVRHGAARPRHWA